ncbi:hypothetical protein LOTGIDRAFT_217203 [Lottia gigantea]|uniref:J domain-containing protein n=1 Tax=Lottia gigantea TaxID=225164 RepID=V4AFB8_LOTGI|nr:hypothetical protein LOTGIDRAFT_217203 [Lottia gigantea]ESO92056.1 hypothetical protein LOTGIDRAFT_217203 [Lottia gigantea]
MSAPGDEDDERLLTTDYYSLLNVSRDAKEDEITNAFRQLSKIYHPDKHYTPRKKKLAQNLFTKIKHAHEVLKDKHKRAIYDMYGESGLRTEDLEVISRTKSPAEIIAEYERLQREREERRLEQRTNPKGNISVTVNATDLFDSYDSEYDYYSASTSIDISGMSVSQSVECPLTVKDTVIIGGELSTHNGTGDGIFVTTWRRLTSDKSWAELEMGVGGQMSGSVKFFRQISPPCFLTIAGGLQQVRGGFKPTLVSLLAYQFDKNLQGRITWNALAPSSVATTISYSSEKNHALFTVHIGIKNSFLSASYTRKLLEDEGRIRGAFRIGTYGYVIEYGVEKKITKFSFLKATMVVGLPVGVVVKFRLMRGNQTFNFRVNLSEGLNPSAVFYGTILPSLAYFGIRKMIIMPYLKRQKERDIERKRSENAEKLSERKKEAESAIELMKESFERCIEIEEKKNGLIIIQALYGNLEASESSELYIDVTVPVQVLVKESKLILTDNSTRSYLPGFYDPCIGEDNKLFIRYKFHHRLHQVTLSDNEPIRLPQQKHFMKDELGGSSTRS